MIPTDREIELMLEGLNAIDQEWLFHAGLIDYIEDEDE